MISELLMENLLDSLDDFFIGNNLMEKEGKNINEFRDLIFFSFELNGVKG